MMDELRADGQVLRQLRRKRWLLQRELADAAGLHKETVRRIEAEEGWSTRMSTILALAKALEVDPEELLLKEEGDSNGRPRKASGAIGLLGRPGDLGEPAFLNR